MHLCAPESANTDEETFWDWKKIWARHQRNYHMHTRLERTVGAYVDWSGTALQICSLRWKSPKTTGPCMQQITDHSGEHTSLTKYLEEQCSSSIQKWNHFREVTSACDEDKLNIYYQNAGQTLTHWIFHIYERNLDVSLLQEGVLIHTEGVDAAEGSPKTLTSPGAACIPAELLKAAVVSREEKNINKTRSSDNTKHIGRSLQRHRQSGLLSLPLSLRNPSWTGRPCDDQSRHPKWWGRKGFLACSLVTVDADKLLLFPTTHTRTHTHTHTRTHAHTRALTHAHTHTAVLSCSRLYAVLPDRPPRWSVSAQRLQHP